MENITEYDRDEVPRYKKKSAKHKPFAILYRGIKFWREWSVYSRYAKQSDMEKAYHALISKGDRFFEFKRVYDGK